MRGMPGGQVRVSLPSKELRFGGGGGKQSMQLGGTSEAQLQVALGEQGGSIGRGRSPCWDCGCFGLEWRA